jgi:hypothetical protein
MAMVFHLPLFVAGTLSAGLEARVLGCLMWFWVAEDFLWFVMNPAFGVRKFRPAFIPWHKRWFLGLPVDYWGFGGLGALLLRLGFA